MVGLVGVVGVVGVVGAVRVVCCGPDGMIFWWICIHRDFCYSMERTKPTGWKSKVLQYILADNAENCQKHVGALGGGCKKFQFCRVDGQI